MSTRQQAGARWFVMLMVLLSACRGEEAKAPEPGQDAAPALEIPALPDFGPLGALEPDTTGGPWARKADIAAHEEFQVTLLQGGRTAVPDRAPMETRIRQTFTLIREVISKDDELTRIRLHIKDPTFTPLEPDGTPGPVPPGLASVAPAIARAEVHMAMDARGRIVELEVSKASNLPRGMEDLFHQLVRDLQVLLPEKATAPGDSWADAGDLPVEREKSRNLVRWELQGSYRGMVERDGVRCAVLEVNGDLDEEGRVDRGGIQGKVTGRGQVRKIALIEADTGRLRELRMVSALARQVSYGNEAPGKGRIEELTMELSLQAKDCGEENK